MPLANQALSFIWIAVGGVAVGTLHERVPSKFHLWVLLVCSCGLLARRPAVFRYAAVAAMSFLLGTTAASADSHALDALASEVPRCELHGYVQERAGKLGTLVSATELSCEGHPDLGHAGIVIAEDLDHDPGAGVALEGWLMPFSEESWDQARARTGADASFEITDAQVTQAPSGLLGAATTVRGSLKRAVRRTEPAQAALVRGLTIGDTSDIDPATEDEFRRTGLAHLVAVSGSNVAIVLAAVVVAVRRLRPLTRTLSCVAALTFYVVIVGPEPSVLRAAAMGTIVIAGLVWGHRAEPLHALGLALIALIAIRPGLTSSVGLHLSAAATAGLVLWARPLAETLQERIPKPIAWGLGATLAAQIAVAPIMIIVFGEVSLVAPLANVLALPAVAPATVLGLMSAILGLAVPALGSLAGSLAGTSAGWILFIADRLARPSWASVNCPASVGWTLAIVVTSAALVTLRRSRKVHVAGVN